jgi:hypothetical protein
LLLYGNLYADFRNGYSLANFTTVIHEEKSNKMQQCIKMLLFHIYMKFIMFRHSVPDNVYHLHVQQPSTYENPEAASAVLGS